MMKLIADSGATKTDWACITNDRRCIRFSSAGYNPNYITADWIVEDITSAFPSDLNLDEICEVFFYGAGITKLLEPFMKSALQQAFPKATKKIPIIQNCLKRYGVSDICFMIKDKI